MIEQKKIESKNEKPLRLLRLKQVLNRVPVSPSTWWRGVNSGRFPRPIQLSERATAWLESDINELIQKLTEGKN